MTRAKTTVALSIAGSDSSAGAGIQADLKTFSALGVYGATVITAVTAQNTMGVTAIHKIPASMIAAQIDAVFSDLNVGAVKTGMLGDETAITAVCDGLERWANGVPIVVDPVMVSTSGSQLLEAGAEQVLIKRLMPMAAIITPNLLEAAALLNATPARNDAQIERQAKQLCGLGANAVLIKGGHRAGALSSDVFYDGQALHVFSAPRLDTKNTHGTGCTLSSAIAAHLLRGLTVIDAIDASKRYLQHTLGRADELNIGSGSGPVFHFAHRDTQI